MSYSARLDHIDKLMKHLMGSKNLINLAKWYREKLDLATSGNHADPKLPRRVTPMNLLQRQRDFWSSPSRFIALPAGRRSGKTELAKRKLIDKAIGPQRFPDAWYIEAAPTRDQAKRIFWADLKRMVPADLQIGRPNERDLTIKLYNGAEITVMGMEVPERAEGKPLDGILLDEYGNMYPDVWTEHVRAALSDRQGFAWFMGVPEGRNHYYELYDRAARCVTGEWEGFTWTSEEVLPLYLGVEAAAREIASAQADMDELTYNQEYRASFVNFTGSAYYPFDARLNAQIRLPYNPRADLIFCFDFNVSPGVAVALQEVMFSDGIERTCCIGEVWIPRNSNTPAVCKKLIADWGTHEGAIYCYGDATGGARGTAKVSGSDWDLIKQEFTAHFGPRMHLRVAKSNPPERVRVNSLNARIRTMTGQLRLLVDPLKCPHLIKDLEGVRLLEGGSGEIDKLHDMTLTHITDALGYYVVSVFPVVHRMTKTTSV